MDFCRIFGLGKVNLGRGWLRPFGPRAAVAQGGRWRQGKDRRRRFGLEPNRDSGGQARLAGGFHRRWRF